MTGNGLLVHHQDGHDDQHGEEKDADEQEDLLQGSRTTPDDEGTCSRIGSG